MRDHTNNNKGSVCHSYYNRWMVKKLNLIIIYHFLIIDLALIFFLYFFRKFFFPQHVCNGQHYMLWCNMVKKVLFYGSQFGLQ